MSFLALKMNYFNLNKSLSRIFMVDGEMENPEKLMFLPTEITSQYKPGNGLKPSAAQQKLLKIILLIFCVSLPLPVFWSPVNTFGKSV